MFLNSALRLLGVSLAAYGQALTIPRTLAAASSCAPSTSSTRLFSSSDSIMASSSSSSDKKDGGRRTIRILALHGSEGTAENFAQRLEPWQLAARDDLLSLDLEIVTITAPVPKGRGFAWWSMPPYVRSYNATTYERFEESEQAVLRQLDEQGPFDLVMGFSQGAILSTSLLALKTVAQRHPRLGFILVGGAWPNPFTTELESLAKADDDNNSSCFQNNHILIVTGEQDAINPPEQSQRIQKALQAAGCPVSLLTFEGGHVVPRDGAILGDILQWIQQTTTVD